jgi:CBS domain-containing protein
MEHVESTTPLISLDAVVVDTETTGLDTAKDRVIQIGLLPVRRGRIADGDAWERLIDPGGPIPPASTAIHGIDDAMVTEAGDFATATDDIEMRLAGAVLIGHNIGFDTAMLAAEYQRIGRSFAPGETLDTAALARLAHPLLADYALDTVARQFGIAIAGRHTAGGDAAATAALFLALLPALKSRGIRTLGEALRACREAGTVAESTFRRETGSGMAYPRPLGALVEDTYPFQKRVGEIMSAPALTLPPEAGIADAARLLAEKSISAVFVVDGNGAPQGIVTERDLMRMLLRPDVTPDWPLSAVMSGPLACIGEDRFLYQAIAEMRRRSIRHLGVTDGAGRLIGALSSGDALRHRTEQAVSMSGDIGAADGAEALAAAWGLLPGVVRALRRDGLSARETAAVIAEQLAAMTARAAELAETAMEDAGEGPPPASYCLMLLGSGGRGETLLAPDQDNAVIYGDAKPETEAWFVRFAEIMSEILDAAGIPFCNGGVMAKNPDWRGDPAQWQARADRWVGLAVWQDMTFVDIFYDFRVIHGDAALARAVEDHAFARAKRHPGFIRQLATIVTDLTSPFTLFGNIETMAGRANLKTIGLLPIVSAARALALRNDIRPRDSKSRFAAVRALGEVSTDDIDNALSAHETILGLVLDQQLDDLEHGIPPGNAVAISCLSKPERQALKRALHAVAALKSLVGDDTVW